MGFAQRTGKFEVVIETGATLVARQMLSDRYQYLGFTASDGPDATSTSALKLRTSYEGRGLARGRGVYGYTAEASRGGGQRCRECTHRLGPPELGSPPVTSAHNCSCGFVTASQPRVHLSSATNGVTREQSM